MEELEKLFINKRFEIMELKDAIRSANISSYILKLSNKDFIELFL